jgi:hypothetical protein
MHGPTLRIAVAGAAALAATALAPAAVSRAAPSAQTDALSTIHGLEADGYRVVVNRSGMGSAPLYDCSVSGVRPGADESIVLVDVNCNRDS